MRTNELEKYRAMLLARVDEVTKAPGHRDEILVERTADSADEVKLAESREFAIHLLDRESRERKDIRAALDRIRTGTFGQCLECDEPIPAKRLATIPWANYCVRCQELHDRARSGSQELEAHEWAA